MAAAMCQALLSFHSGYRKNSLTSFVSSDFYEKYTVTQKYCVSSHNSLCSLEICNFNLFLIVASRSEILLRLEKDVHIY